MVKMDNILYSIYKKKSWRTKLFAYYNLRNKNNVPPFRFDLMSEDFSRLNFRFSKEDVLRLRRALQIPFTIVCEKGSICDGTEGLCILLRRLAYPNRLSDLCEIFKRNTWELSRIINHLIDYILERFGFLLQDLDQDWLSPNSLELFANAIAMKNAPLDLCWGFIDGTVRPICRPTYMQRQCYNGHKRIHALKYQSIVTPNGLVANLFGPIEGRRHDAILLTESNILPALQRKFNAQNRPLYIYGDPAYPIRSHILCPYRGGRLSDVQQEFNSRMSSVRVSVEWVFGKIVNLWGFIDFKKNQKLFLQPVAKYFKVAVLVTNCHSCIYGSQTSTFFNVAHLILKCIFKQEIDFYF